MANSNCCIYKSCPYCLQDILKKPILEKHQNRYSILCPYCLSHRSEWVDTIENAVISWNIYMREEELSLFELKRKGEG